MKRFKSVIDSKLELKYLRSIKGTSCSGSSVTDNRLWLSKIKTVLMQLILFVSLEHNLVNQLKKTLEPSQPSSVTHSNNFTTD